MIDNHPLPIQGDWKSSLTWWLTIIIYPYMEMDNYPLPLQGDWKLSFTLTWWLVIILYTCMMIDNHPLPLQGDWQLSLTLTRRFTDDGQLYNVDNYLLPLRCDWQSSLYSYKKIDSHPLPLQKYPLPLQGDWKIYITLNLSKGSSLTITRGLKIIP